MRLAAYQKPTCPFFLSVLTDYEIKDGMGLELYYN